MVVPIYDKNIKLKDDIEYDFDLHIPPISESKIKLNVKKITKAKR